MRITTRIALGLALLAGLMIATMGYQFASLQKMHRITRDLADELIALDDPSIAQRAESSAAAAEDARRTSLVATGVTAGLALLIAFVLYRSIAGPVRRLRPGTRELAQGHLAHRLEVKGRTELAELARDFNQLAEQLGELEQVKQDFVAHISHELKGPLAAIHETILILLEEIPGPLTAKQAHLLELSQQSAGRLSAMIGNVLEVSRLEAATDVYDPRRHDVAHIIRSVLHDVESLVIERDVRLSLTVDTRPTDALCDGDRIRAAVHNLVRNAVVFSPEGGRIQVGLARIDALPAAFHAHWSGNGSPPDDGPFLLFSVADEGPGIPEENKLEIFDKFYQLRREKPSQGQGAGLGLYICSRVADAHHGAVWVDDPDGKGATFKLLIPTAPRHWTEQAPRPRLRNSRLTATSSPT